MSRAQRGPRATACVVIAFLLTAATAVQPAVAAPSTKYYSATPAAVLASTTAPAVISLTDCKPCVDPSTGRSLSSTQSFGSAEVRFATGKGLDATGASLTSPLGVWKVTTRFEGSDTVLRVTNPGPGSTYAVAPGKAITLSLPVTAGTTAAQVPIRTQVKQSNDFSGTGNDITRVGPDPVVYVGAGPADHLRIAQGASTVQVSPSSTTGAILTMCEAPRVEVVDAQDRVVTWLPPSVATVSSGATSAGLQTNGPVTTASGVATFGAPEDLDGACFPTVGDGSLSATVLGRGYHLTVSIVVGTRTLTVTDTGAFDVLSFYVRCPGACSATDASSTTTAAVSAVRPSSSSGPAVGAALTFGVGVDAWDSPASACNPDVGGTGTALNPYRTPVTIDLRDHDKTVQLRWSKKAVQFATNNGSSQWGVCMAAAYPFTTASGGTTPAPTVTGGWYVGLLPRCGAVAAGNPCIASLGRQGGEQLATVSLPDIEGDPRMI